MRTLMAALLAVAASPAVAQVTHPHAGMTLVRAGSSALVVTDLCAAGVSVRATKYGERNARAQTWADGVGAMAAVNADFFDFPGWSYVVGRARGGGVDWPAGQQQREARPYWQFGPRLAAMVGNGPDAPAAGVTEIVGGHNILILNGQSRAPNFDGDAVITTAHRRTAVGLSADRRFLYLYATNNNFTGTQVVAELEALRVQAGAPPIDVATNMDGGGSSQLYVRGVGAVIDSTRPVNNHLGVYATGSGAAPQCPKPPDLRDVALRGDGKSGWTLDARGRIAAFGGAPALGPAGERWSFDVARRLALREGGASAYLLDGWGGIHEVGGAPAVTSATAYWPNWDIARAIVLRRDGTSGYVLEGYGGLHPFGGAPAVTGGPYWAGNDIARDVVLRGDGVSGWVLDGLGVLHPFGGAPALQQTKTFTTDVAVRVVLSFDERSGYVVDKTGALWPFGDAPPVKSRTFADGQAVSLGLGSDAVSGVVLHAQEGPVAFHSAHLARVLAMRPGTRSGYLLRGDGALDSFGGAPALTPSKWVEWDIARDVQLMPDGKSGYVLDGWGGAHAFGVAAPPPATGQPYWPNWDIVRAFAPGPQGSLGYLVDGYGGVHPLGESPELPYTGYTPGTDIARDIVTDSSGRGGFTLDGQGALHPFGATRGGETGALWGWDIGRAIALRPDGVSGWVLDGWGGLHPFGGAGPAGQAPYFPGHDVFRDAVVVSPTQLLVLDVYGHVYDVTVPAGWVGPHAPSPTSPQPVPAVQTVGRPADPGSVDPPSQPGGCSASGAGAVLVAASLALLLRRRPAPPGGDAPPAGL
ncbi:MAG: phosphodiester glycosidase family protein [Archangiaceae bacterium]|nr:phosphodiester glycosidase family protein [Archangiaceae bacterium]